MKIDYSQPKIITKTVLLAAVILAVVLTFLTGCSGAYYLVEQPQHTCELTVRGDACLSDHSCCKPRDHSTEMYYHNDLPYWGMYNNYYYYYGVPHVYPWWYYYTIMPVYTYNIQTHVHISLDRGNIVRTPRGTKFNNSNGRTYKPNKVATVKPVRTIKTNINRTNNRSNVKTNTNSINIRTNTNKTNIRTNTNRTNIRTNTNRTNVKPVRTNKRTPR